MFTKKTLLSNLSIPISKNSHLTGGLSGTFGECNFAVNHEVMLRDKIVTHGSILALVLVSHGSLTKL